MTTQTPLIEALEAQWGDQPDKPTYEVGTAVEKPEHVYVGVNRVATPDHPFGFSTGSGLVARKYAISLPQDRVTWLVGALGAYLTDEQWDEAAAQRERRTRDAD